MSGQQDQDFYMPISQHFSEELINSLEKAFQEEQDQKDLQSLEYQQSPRQQLQPKWGEVRGQNQQLQGTLLQRIKQAYQYHPGKLPPLPRGIGPDNSDQPQGPLVVLPYHNAKVPQLQQENFPDSSEQFLQELLQHLAYYNHSLPPTSQEFAPDTNCQSLEQQVSQGPPQYPPYFGSQAPQVPQVPQNHFWNTDDPLAQQQGYLLDQPHNGGQVPPQPYEYVLNSNCYLSEGLSQNPLYLDSQLPQRAEEFVPDTSDQIPQQQEPQEPQEPLQYPKYYIGQDAPPPKKYQKIAPALPLLDPSLLQRRP